MTTISLWKSDNNKGRNTEKKLYRPMHEIDTINEAKRLRAASFTIATLEKQ